MTQLEVDVCLVVSTQSATLAEVTSRLGVEGADGSHDMGTPQIIERRGMWPSTTHQVCSTRPRTCPVEEHLEDVLASLPPARVAPGMLPADARKYISIGVFSNAQIPTVMLTERALEIAAAFGAPIELRWYYPSDEE
jgi:hypothetical protein